ncbi:MAG: ATP-binding protein [Mariniphaga sp.]
MKEILKTLISDFQSKLPFNLIGRNLTLPINSSKIITVTGIRRCGKSFLLYDTMNRLISNGINKEFILFINFDDERLRFDSTNLDLIVQAYRELNPTIPFEKVYLFFDEIQMADGWESFIRRIYDSVCKNIFLSGSNAKLLASEIATSLRGRTLQLEAFPLGFDEYCRFRKIDTNYVITENRILLQNGFSQFLSKGGFPELVLSDFQFFDGTVQEYYHVMLYKDLIERYDIRNIPVLKYLVARLLVNTGKPTSINKIYNELKSAGLKLDKNLLYTLTDQLQSIYFIQRIGKYDPSLIKTELALEKKCYFADNSFLTALNFVLSNDRGKLLENIVFLWLRSQFPFGRGLFFTKGKKECDFVVIDRDKPVALIQVCWNIDEKATLQRELDGLVELSNYFNCNQLVIITSSAEKEIAISGKTVRIIPAWKLMLQNRFNFEDTLTSSKNTIA